MRFEVDATTVDVEWESDVAAGQPNEHGQQVSIYKVTLDADEIWTQSFTIEATSSDEALMIAERETSRRLQDA